MSYMLTRDFCREALKKERLQHLVRVVFHEDPVFPLPVLDFGQMAWRSRVQIRALYFECRRASCPLWIVAW